jgi:CDP-2,3-bis-(O-geranylgeranyl)-sn-glycerol synthase
VNAVWVFLPVLGAALLHAPVLALDLFPALKRPLDGGRTWRDARIFGDNKTWRGAVFMTTGVWLATIALWQWPWWRGQLPGEVRDAGPVLVGLLIGLGTVLEPGTQRRSAAGLALTVLDQGDFVFGIWVLLLPVWVMSVPQAAFAFVVVVAVHLVINVIGYAIGARAAPI